MNKRQTALLEHVAVTLEEAIARVELANSEGDPILSAWLHSARTSLGIVRDINREELGHE